MSSQAGSRLELLDFRPGVWTRSKKAARNLAGCSSHLLLVPPTSPKASLCCWVGEGER